MRHEDVVAQQKSAKNFDANIKPELEAEWLEITLMYIAGDLGSVQQESQVLPG